MTWTPLGDAGKAGTSGMVDSGEPGEAGNLHYRDVTLTQNLPIGTLVLLRATTAYGGIGAGATNRHKEIRDTLGNVWTKVGEYTRGEEFESAFDGQIVSLWLSQLTVALSISDTLRLMVEFNARFDVAIALNAVDIGGAESTVTVLGQQGDSGYTQPAVATLTLGAAADAVWLGVACHQGSGTPPGSLDTDFTTDLALYTPHAFAILWGQYRLDNIDSQTWTAAGTTNRGWTVLLAALELGVAEEPPPPPIADPGPREFQEDFETENHGVSGTSTIRRPDAVSLDYLTAHCMGPVDIEDLSEGLEARRWRIRVIPWDESPETTQEVLISRSNSGNTAWEAEATLFFILQDESVTVFAVEVALCFDEAGRPVVAWERPSGAGGTPEVWINAFGGAAHFAGRTPRVALDLFPYVGVHCPPLVDVQLVYLKPGEGLKRRQERDAFLVEYDTSITDDANLFLELFLAMPTLRVLRLWYSRLNPATGRYIRPTGGGHFPYIDSQPYGEVLLARPSFNPGTVFDLTWFGNSGQLWRVPAASTQTDAYSLQISVTDDVDDIELQCADSLPSGLQPDSGGIWTVQNQNRGSPLSAGGAHSFSVSVDHGNLTMSPNVFRVRTKRTTSGIECWSPWRYWFAAIQGTQETAIASYTLVNCGFDAVVCPVADSFPWVTEANWFVAPPNFCESEAEVSSASLPCFFVAGWQPFPPLTRRDWSVHMRSMQDVGFSDPDGVYAFTLIGAAFLGANEGSGMPLPDGNQSPGQFPP